MTTVAEKPARSRVMMAEPGSWLVLLGGLAEQAARVAEADRGRAALLAAVSHDLRAPLAAAKAAAIHSRPLSPFRPRESGHPGRVAAARPAGHAAG